MAYARRRFRRFRPFRRVRRRFIRRRRRIRPVGSSPLSKRFFKLRAVTNVVAATTQSQTLKYGDDPADSGDWSNVITLFDYYRVNGMRLDWIPAGNIRQLGVAATNNAPLSPIFVLHDYNNTLSTNANSNTFLENESCRIKGIYYKWKIYYKMMRATQPSGTQTQLAGGYLSTTQPIVTQSVAIHIPDVTGITSGVILGRLVRTWYCSFKGRR